MEQRPGVTPVTGFTSAAFGIRRDRPIAGARWNRRACQHRWLRQALRRP
jgi:hypothetical protein